ncbi:MarR family winged helix-turn-helix transcriptional regulator [Actinokineospora sp. HUAS TT18]|uniref:MarR family winged helix-turn-helix transcriptional regulator n=1 Tax=Actinokineospora sp. HUAS TT18 TaxID=3447451 RepID=UPI003F52249E
MTELDHLDSAMNALFLLRGVLEPTREADGLGASISESLALRFLDQTGECAQGTLADHLGLEKSTVSRLVDAMVAKGWIGKDRSATNRRFVTLTLTPAGREFATEVAEAIRRRHIAMFTNMSPDERAAVAIALPALVRALKAPEAHDGERSHR